MARLVLTDASPLIGLARVDGLAWLRDLFGQVWMPAEVRQEVLAGDASQDREAIVAAERAGWIAVCEATPTLPELPELDEGESACIRIAVQNMALQNMALHNRGASLILMDERAGRAIAMEHGLRIAGTAAVIGMARSRNLIPSARAVFARLHASDFRISAQVIEAVLRRVAE